MLFRLKHTVNAARAFVDSYGIWLAVHPGPGCTRLIREGSVALRLGDYAQRLRGVYLVEGARVILDERELEPVKGRGK